MIRRLLLAAGLIAAIGFVTEPAQAIPIGGGGGGHGSQTVYAYFSDAAHANFVGERWTGCPSNPAGSWGASTRYVYVYTLEC